MLMMGGAVQLLSPGGVRGQDGSMRVRPQSPTAASLGEYGDVPVALYTGTPNITVPLFTAQGRALSVPLALTYHGGGIRVEEQASWVGLGWSLVAGGTITRTVRGLADDLTNGYYSNGHTFYANANWSSPDSMMLDNIASGLLDGEPDQYFFNFQGRTGKFVMGPTDSTGTVKEVRTIPYQKLDIVPVLSAGKIHEWEVTTEDGTKYTFTAREVNKDKSSSNLGGAVPAHFGLEHTSAWHLTKIQTVGGDEATFYYTKRGTTHRGVGFREKYHYDSNDCVPSEAWMNNEYDLDIQVLDSIKTSVQTVHFATSKRTDAKSPTGVQQEYKLDEITVKSAGGTVISKYELDTDYSLGGRLTLKNVYETDSSGNKLPPHTFTYDMSATLPAVTSYNTDHWGFFNGANNSAPYPGMPAPEDPDEWLDGADRDPDAAKVKTGSLTKITYPTGGETEFDWEINDYGKIGQSGAQPYTYGAEESEFALSEDNDETVTETFVIGGVSGTAIPVEIIVIIDPDSCGGLVGCPRAKVVGESAEIDEDSTFTLLLEPGTYQLEAYSDFPDGLAQITASWRELNAENKKLGGGLRIQEIRNKDGMGNTTTRTFDYTLESDATRSSGVVSTEPRYGFHNQTGCSYASRQSRSRAPLGEGPAVGYSEVTVKHGVNGVYGTTRTTFRSVLDKQDEILSVSDQPNLRATTYGWMRGQTVEERTRNQAGQNQRRTVSDHAFKSSEPTTRRTFRGMAVQEFGQSSPFSQSINAWNKFEVISEWTYLESDTTWVYDESGSSSVKTSRAYEYGNANHVQLTKLTETNGDGSQRITRMKYALDYPSGSGNTEASTIQAMKGSAHMHSPVIERWVSEKPVGGSESVVSALLTVFYTYNFWDGSAWVGHYLPRYRYVLASDGPVTSFTPSTISSTLTWDAKYKKVETAYAYDDWGRLKGHWDAEGHVTTYEYYDANTHLPTRQYEYKSGGPVSLWTDYVYDSRGRVTQLKEYGKSRYFSYDAFNRLATVKDHNNAVVSRYSYVFSRQPSGWTFSASSPNYVETRTFRSATDSTVARQYLDGLGRALQTQVKDGAKWVVTHTEYDVRGRVEKEWRPYSYATGGSYESDTDVASHAAAEYSGAGAAYTLTAYTSDPLDRPKTVTPPYESSASSMSYVYGVTGNDSYVEVTDEIGNKTRTYADGFGNTVKSIGGYGTSLAATTTFTNNVLGSRTKTTDPRGLVTTYTMNTQGLVAKRVNPDAGTTQFKYDAEGNVRYAQDANQAAGGNVFFQNYDFLERPLVAGVGSATFSGLDSYATSPAAFEADSTHWIDVRAYDAKPSTSAFPWSLFSSEISGASLSNLKGRLAAVAALSDGAWQLTLVSYDANGLVDKKYIYTHNNGTTTVLAALNTEIDYTLDLQGAPTERDLSVGSGGSAQDFYHWYEYDTRGLIDEVFASTSSTKPTNPVASFRYSSAAQLDTLQYQGGSALPYDYHVRGWLTDIGDASGTTHPFSARYAYLANGNVTTAEFYNGGVSNASAAYYRHHGWRFSYDALNRMTEGVYRWYNSSGPQDIAYYNVKSISYDANGNLKTLRRYNDVAQQVDQIYNYNYPSTSNRLTGFNDISGTTSENWDMEGGGGTAFTYDANGNMLTAPGPYNLTAITYDHRNLPTSVTTNSVTSKNRYNQDGQRIMKKEGSADPVFYVLDGSLPLAVFTINSSGSAVDWEFNITSGERTIGRKDKAGNTRFYYADLLGSTRVVVDQNNAIKESVDYDPMGLRLQGRTTGSGTTRIGFTGKERDAVSQLDYFGARFYMPALGRWGSPDPLAEKHPDWNPYNYVLGNPNSLIDPDGLQVSGTRAVADVAIGVTPVVSTVHDGTVLLTGYNVATNEYAPIISWDRAFALGGVVTPLSGPTIRVGITAAGATGRRLLARARNLFRSPESTQGIATITEHAGDHASITVTYADEVVSTHQVRTLDGSTTVQTFTDPPAEILNEVTVTLPNAPAAQAQQRSLSGTVTGAYDVNDNSCVTHCGDILRAGGVDGVPANTRGIIKWLLRLANGDPKP